MGVAAIAAEQQVGARLHFVPASDEGEVVGQFIAAGNSQRRQEDLAPKGAEAVYFELRPSRVVGDHVKLVVDKLRAGFILSLRAELVVPASHDRAACGSADLIALRKAH